MLLSIIKTLKFTLSLTTAEEALLIKARQRRERIENYYNLNANVTSNKYA